MNFKNFLTTLCVCCLVTSAASLNAMKKLKLLTKKTKEPKKRTRRSKSDTQTKTTTAVTKNNPKSEPTGKEEKKTLAMLSPREESKTLAILSPREEKKQEDTANSVARVQKFFSNLLLRTDVKNELTQGTFDTTVDSNIGRLIEALLKPIKDNNLDEALVIIKAVKENKDLDEVESIQILNRLHEFLSECSKKEQETIKTGITTHYKTGFKVLNNELAAFKKTTHEKQENFINKKDEVIETLRTFIEIKANKIRDIKRGKLDIHTLNKRFEPKDKNDSDNEIKDKDTYDVAKSYTNAYILKKIGMFEQIESMESQIEKIAGQYKAIVTETKSIQPIKSIEGSEKK